MCSRIGHEMASAFKPTLYNNQYNSATQRTKKKRASGSEKWSQCSKSLERVRAPVLTVCKQIIKRYVLLDLLPPKGGFNVLMSSLIMVSFELK